MLLDPTLCVPALWLLHSHLLAYSHVLVCKPWGAITPERLATKLANS